MRTEKIATEEAEKEIRICRGCPYLIAAQREYHKLCRAVNKKFGGIKGWTCGVRGYSEDKKEEEDYYKRIGIDIETGLPIEASEDGILEELIKKLEKDYVYYYNATLGWSSPPLIARGNYAHELLGWIREQKQRAVHDFRGAEDEAK